MAIINIFTKQKPEFNIGGAIITFDAVFEDVIEGGVEFTQFPIEIGATATDHGVILPNRYTITAAVSNNPLDVNVLDVAAGVLSNAIDSTVLNQFNVFLASFLSGSNETRAGSTLETLFSLMYSREPFDVNAGDVTLQSMVITNITRTKTAENEGGLVFTAELQELPLLSTVITRNQPGQSVLRLGTPESTQATSDIFRGQVRLQDAANVVLSQVGLAL